MDGCLLLYSTTWRLLNGPAYIEARGCYSTGFLQYEVLQAM